MRKQAIKDLPVICKACPNYCQKVSNVLTQLLHGSDTLEMSLAQMSLMSMLRVNAKTTLAGIFGQILEGEETVRTKAISFLTSKMKVLISEDLLSKDGGEEYFISQCRKVCYCCIKELRSISVDGQMLIFSVKAKHHI